MLRLLTEYDSLSLIAELYKDVNCQTVCLNAPFGGTTPDAVYLDYVRAIFCVTFQGTNHLRGSWLSTLPRTGRAEGKGTDGDPARISSSSSSPPLPSSSSSSSAESAQPDLPARDLEDSGSPVRLLTGSQCVLQGDGRYSGVVLERKVLAPPQRNLGWLKKHRWGNVPAGGGSVSGVSFSVLHLYDKADFRKVGLSTCIRRGCGSGLCPWMMQHSPLSTFFTLFPKQWHLIRAAVHLLVLSPQACPHFMCLSRRIERRQLSKPDSSFTFPLNNIHFLYRRCYGSDFLFFKTLLFSYYRMLAVLPLHLVKRCWSLIWHKPAMVTVIHTYSSHWCLEL